MQYLARPEVLHNQRDVINNVYRQNASRVRKFYTAYTVVVETNFIAISSLIVFKIIIINMVMKIQI